MLKKFLIVFLFYVVTAAISAYAATNNVFIAQNSAGTNDGSSCANAKAVSYFNTSGNWSATPTGIQIGPGTTVHLCGTFTGTAGSTMLTFQGDGASGNPITLRFETGSGLTAPFWAGNPNGAVSLGSHSHIVVDGVSTTNIALQSTANGTNLANQVANYGFTAAGGSDLTFQNLAIINMYVRVCCGNELADGSTVRAITVTGVNGVTFQNNLIHDVGWALSIDSTSDNATIGPGNEIFNADHDVAPGAPHWKAFGNHFHDWGVWDDNTGSNKYHHDGIHCFSDNTGHTVAADIYNNLFDGAVGTKMNQFIFLEGNTSNTKCTATGATVHIFNNVMIANNPIVAAAAFYGNSNGNEINDLFVNNTILNNVPGATPPTAISFQNVTNATVENNAVGGAGTLFGDGGTNVSTFLAVDYNAYQNCTSFNCFFAQGVDSGSFATWQAGNCTGSVNTCDQHGLANLSSSTFFQFGPNCVPGFVGATCPLQYFSPLRSAGVNLNSLCSGQPNPGLGALCFDINGVRRPQAGVWDIGAVQTNWASLHAPAAYVAPIDTNVHGYTRSSTPPPEFVWQTDPDFLGSVKTSFFPNASDTGTPYFFCGGPQVISQLQAIEPAFSSNASLYTYSTSEENAWSVDGKFLMSTTSQGGQDAMIGVDLLTPKCTGKYIVGFSPMTGLTTAGGDPAFSKSEPGILYVSAQGTDAKVMRFDAYQKTITQVVDWTTQGNFPAGLLPQNANSTIDTTTDYMGAGHDTMLVASMGITGESGNSDRYAAACMLQSDGTCGGIVWWDTKNDACGTNGSWPGGAPSISFNCTGFTGLNITNTSLTSNTATYNWTLGARNNSNTIPAAGKSVTVQGTTNGGGIFNVTNATIVTATPTQFTISITHADVGSQPESALATIASQGIHGDGSCLDGTVNPPQPYVLNIVNGVGPTVWTPGTTTVVNATPIGTAGHRACGGDSLYSWGTAPQTFNGVKLSNPNVQTTNLPRLPCSVTPNTCTDGHHSGVMMAQNNVGMLCSASYLWLGGSPPSAGNEPTGAGQNELVCGSRLWNPVYRFTHNMTNAMLDCTLDGNGNCSSFGNGFFDLVNGNGMTDGSLWAYSSNYGGFWGKPAGAQTYINYIFVVGLQAVSSGGSPTVTLNPNSINFGIQLIGQTSPQQIVTLSNVGTGSLSINSISIAGTNAAQFALVTPNSGTDCRIIGTVPAGGNCNIAATFTPNAVQVFNASISITDSAANSPQSVSLTGSVVSQPPGLPTMVAGGMALSGSISN